MLDLVGKHFGRWTVISFAGVRNSNSQWLCRCECGVEKTVLGCNLMTGKSNSCGCLARELTSLKNRKHGLTRTPTYVSWALMKQRCYDQHNPSYKNYGARGIKVCKRWHKFENFYSDMGDRPGSMSIERKDNDGNYEPSNCVWASPQEQARNRRSNKLITYNGETVCLAELAEQCKIDQDTLGMRLLRGMSVEDAISIPLRKRK